MLPRANRNALDGSKQLQVERLGHRGVPYVVRMKKVARIVSRKEPRRRIWVPNHRVKIDDVIVRPACPDPIIDGLAGRLAVGAPIVRNQGSLTAYDIRAN